jgi:hypothetical protein
MYQLIATSSTLYSKFHTKATQLIHDWMKTYKTVEYTRHGLHLHQCIDTPVHNTSPCTDQVRDLLLRLSLPHSEDVVQTDSHSNIEDHIGPDNSKVAPSVTPIDLLAAQVLVRGGNGAVLTRSRRIRVVELSNLSGKIFGQVLSTCLS